MTGGARLPSVLVFAGLDPSGGAGLAADVLAIAAQGAHALPVATALTVQDNDRVHAVVPIDTAFVLRQAQVLADTCVLKAVKVGISGNRANAMAIAGWLRRLRERNPLLPIVLDPVLASGHGDPLDEGDPLEGVGALLRLATIALPNEVEARAIACFPAAQLLVTGGHGHGASVTNCWYAHGRVLRHWRWPRLAGSFHGSGCTLAAALAGRLALGDEMGEALDAAQAYCHRTLEQSYAIAPGQRIPRRFFHSST